jgi:hypothetical protein
MGDQPVARLIPAHRTTQTQNNRTHTSIPQMGFEPTIPVFERAKTIHALDRATNVVGNLYHCITKLCKTQTELIRNRVNSNVHGTGQGGARRRRPKLGGGQAYDRSAD